MNTPTIRTFILPVIIGILVSTLRPSRAAETLCGGTNAPATNMVVEMVKAPVVMKGLINSRNPFVYTVGTDTNGVPIQQVEWLYDSPELKRQVCAIFAGTVVEVVKAVDGKAEVKCKKGTPILPIANKLTRQDMLATDAPLGWLDESRLVRVRLAEHPWVIGNVPPSPAMQRVSDVATGKAVLIQEQTIGRVPVVFESQARCLNEEAKPHSR
jgi:hypothetical protein